MCYTHSRVCGNIVSQLASYWHVASGRSFVNAERTSSPNSPLYFHGTSKNVDFTFACELYDVRDLFDEAENSLPNQSTR